MTAKGRVCFTSSPSALLGVVFVVITLECSATRRGPKYGRIGSEGRVGMALRAKDKLGRRGCQIISKESEAKSGREVEFCKRDESFRAVKIFSHGIYLRDAL